MSILAALLAAGSIFATPVAPHANVPVTYCGALLVTEGNHGYPPRWNSDHDRMLYVDAPLGTPVAIWDGVTIRNTTTRTLTVRPICTD